LAMFSEPVRWRFSLKNILGFAKIVKSSTRSF